MKKKLVVVVGRYYHGASAVGQCALNIVEVLKNTYDITVICTSSKIVESKKLIENGIEIRIISTWYLKLLQKCEISSNVFFKIGKQICRFFMILTQPHTNYKQLVRAYKKAISEVKDIDVILPFCMPMEGIIASLDIEDNNAKIFPVIFDSISSSPTLVRFSFLNKQKKLDKIEKNILRECDHAFICTHLKKHIDQHRSEFLDKITYIEHPLITNKFSQRFSESKMIYYAGSIVPGCIELFDFLDIFAEMKNQDKYFIKVNSNLNKKEFVKYSFRLEAGPWINESEYEKEVNHCLAMISMCTKNTKQFASKIFNAISHGKPLILVYYESDHPNVIALEKYPLSLLLNYNDGVAKNAKKLNAWLSTLENINCSYDTIIANYKEFTPTYICEKIREFI